MLTKPELRQHYRQVRAQISAGLRHEKAQQAANQIWAAQAIGDALTVALYAAFGDELDPDVLVPVLRQKKNLVVYPAVTKNGLIFRCARRNELVPVPPWGIAEPPQDLPTVPVSEIDVFIVPGLAFTWAGDRLGYGRGYYDHALAHHPKARCIGFAMACQISPFLPVEAHDRKMDLVVTESAYKWVTR